MATHAVVTAQITSTMLRIVSYLFLRWFPGPGAVPASVFTLFAIYVPSFFLGYLAQFRWLAVEDQAEEVGNGAAGNKPNGTVSSVSDANDQTMGIPGQGAEQRAEQEVEAIEATKTVAVKKQSSRPMQTLLLGSPSPTSLFLSMTTFLINLCLVLMCADFLLAARLYFPSEHVSFVRLGHVSPSEAKFLIREPDQAKMPVTLEIRVKDARPPFDNPIWQLGGRVRRTGESTDYTTTVTVPLMHSHQRIYEWRTSNNGTGEFMAPPKPGKSSAYHDGKFTFLATSCILPRFPYKPSEHVLAIPGLRHLAAALPSLGAHFMLFMGDFIYIDVPLRFGKTKDHYRQKYRHVYASPDWLAVSQNLSWLHVVDDHEIANDWSSQTTGVYETALEPWHNYQGSTNPPPPQKAGTSMLRAGATYYEFTQGPASFFMLDSRTYRSRNDIAPDDAEKTMLGKDQLDDFLYWLNRPEPRGVKWKVIASSIPFTKNWPVNNKDTWGGFLVERRRVLEAMWDAGTRGMGVVILSGDRHEFAATRFPPPTGSRWPDTAAPYEFSASPLNQFSFPLATYRQTDNEDVLIKYINRGSTKFGALTLDTDADTKESHLLYRLFVDGPEVWNMTVKAPPISADVKRGASIWNRLLG